MNQRTVLTITGPSCVGKSYLAYLLTQKYPDQFALPKSVTTRSKRTSEDNEYHFVTADEFTEMIQNKKLMEFTVIDDNFYGTSAQEVNNAFSQGKIPILVVDPKGVRTLQEISKSSKSFYVFSVFLDESVELLVQRWLERFKVKLKSNQYCDIEYMAQRIINTTTKENSWFINYSHLTHKNYYHWSSQVEEVISNIMANIKQIESADIVDGRPAPVLV